MADIDFRRTHRLGLKKARAAAQRLLDDLSEEFELDSEWQGNVLLFARSGVSGQLAVAKDHVTLQARLGFLLSALRPKIEQQIEKKFERYFG